MEHGFDLAPIASSLLQAVPVWGIIGSLFVYLIHRLEKNAALLEKRLKSIEDSILKLNEETKESSNFQDLRSDTTDMAISFLIKDSFSSKMIAKGTGNWPRIFDKKYRET